MPTYAVESFRTMPKFVEFKYVRFFIRAIEEVHAEEAAKMIDDGSEDMSIRLTPVTSREISHDDSGIDGGDTVVMARMENGPESKYGEFGCHRAHNRYTPTAVLLAVKFTRMVDLDS